MITKLLSVIITAVLLIVTANPVNAQDTIRYKSSTNQTIPKNKWVTLQFNGKTAIQGNGARSLFCYQAALDMKGKKKPKYIKIRLARVKSGKDDTTATNIYPVIGKPGTTWVGSSCWTIFTKHPVVVQIRITGGSKTYTSDMRQFKMWTPGGDYPADFSDFIPETTIQ